MRLKMVCGETIRKGLLIFLMTIICCGFVFALGVSPAKIELNPNKEIFSFNVLNSNKEENVISIVVPEGFKTFFALSETELSFAQGEYIKTVFGSLNESFKNKFPGETNLDIFIEERANSKDAVGLASTIKLKLGINYPTKEKFIRLGQITHFRSLNKIDFTIPIENVGSRKINSVIFSGNIIDKETNEVEIHLEQYVADFEPFIKSKLNPVWENYKLGNFSINGQIIYDGIELPLNYDFKLQEIVFYKEQPKREFSPLLATIATLIATIIVLLLVVHGIKKYRIKGSKNSTKHRKI